MSLDKGILHGKEHRKKYRKSKAIDKTCRNHGSCPYCKGNRLKKFYTKLESAKEKEKNFVEFFEKEENEEENC